MSSMATYQNLLIHGPVELGNGWHRKKRHLFLFRDYLLISNTRCKNILKIKCVIPLHIVWMDKVEEGDSEAKKSFLLGWPMENFRATFPSLEQKEKWCSFLERNINLTKEKDNQKTLELPIFIKDIQHSECENEYLLSFNSGKEEAPFTLLGHECPYAIKMNYLGEKAFMPQRPSKLTSQTFQEPIQEQVSPDLKGQFFLGPRHPNKGKHESNEYLPFLEVPSHSSHLHS
ncbi:rho GTPase-activating protein 20-like isoform X2 [Castor canadensis]|uniref:Rho GTPase-activating protein 20-like isoform X2 n=1 Tax=Castor canadensis TaxID=51338 RepID=A0AC58JYP9_CASCN